MRVAYLVNQYPQPSQSFIRREIRALESLGIEVERFTLRATTAPLADAQDREEQSRTRAVLDAGAGMLLLSLLWVFARRPLTALAAAKLAIRLGFRSSRGALIHLIYLAEAAVLLRWLRHSGATHVHAHFGTNSATVAMLCRALGGPPYSFTVHGPEEFDQPQSLGLGEKIGRAEFVVVVSQFGRSQLWRWCPLRDWAKVHVVHCGVDQQFLGGLISEPPASPRLVCVARLHEQKGLPLLLRAAAALVAEGRQFELTVIGDGPLRGELESQMSALHLEQHVTLAGWKSNDEVRQAICASRALVLPSFAEGLPVVIMEALALGRPVVTTQVAGIPELVQSGASGWLVPPGDVDSLVSALREALDASPETLSCLGQRGAALVAREHDAIREAQKLAALFGHDLQPPPPVGARHRSTARQATAVAHRRPRAAVRRRQVAVRAFCSRGLRLSICGVPIAPLTFEATLDLVDRLIAQRRPAYFITANLHYAMLSARCADLTPVNRDATFVLADGMPLVWAARCRGLPLPGRVAGADLTPALCARAAANGHRVFLLGGAEGIAQQAAEKLCRQYPALQVAGIEAPHLDALTDAEQEQLLERIRASRADLLLVAFGQPKGELWIWQHYQKLDAVCVQIGASLDFVAGKVPRAPRLLQRTGLEWAWRLGREPARLAPRYASNAMFLGRLLVSAALPKRASRRRAALES